MKSLNQPDMCTRLYYCGSLEKPNRIPEILKRGFTDEGIFDDFISKWAVERETFSCGY